MKKLLRKKHYLQVALNGTLAEAERVVATLPVADRIIIEAGTPLIKAYGMEAVRRLKQAWAWRIAMAGQRGTVEPFIVADMKTMDRGATEVTLAAEAGADAVVALGEAPVETLNAFLATTTEMNVLGMIDMMNVNQPYKVLRMLNRLPEVVILHQGVDETEDSDKPLPIHMINKIKGAFDLMVAVAGGDTPREVQSAVFNGADIVVVWKDFVNSTGNTQTLAEHFLQQTK